MANYVRINLALAGSTSHKEARQGTNGSLSSQSLMSCCN